MGQILSVIVAPIEGGLFSIIDGQHRATAALLRGAEKVPCEIVHIERAKQAEAFAAINGNTTRVTPQSVYFARLTAKRPRSQEMDKVLSAAGVTIARANLTDQRYEARSDWRRCGHNKNF